MKLRNDFQKSDMAETSTLLRSWISMKYKDKGNLMEYIMEMSHLASKLKALKLELSDDLLIHLVLISLPTQCNQLKVSCNYQKEKWTLCHDPTSNQANNNRSYNLKRSKWYPILELPQQMKNLVSQPM